MNLNSLTDTHFHLTLNNDIDGILKRAKENNVNNFILSCCDINNIKEGLEIIKKYNNIYLTIGLHPDEIKDYNDNTINYLEELIINNKKIIGIGEIGLDYYHNKDNKEEQKELFIKQLDLAKKLNLPVVIHSRDAFQDTYDILKESKVKGDIHCFSGSLENAKRYISLGFLIGIGGVLTFKNTNLRDTIREIDMCNILLETASPYLAPVPFRGDKNEPKNVKIVAELISEIKGISLEEVSRITENNTKELFNI